MRTLKIIVAVVLGLIGALTARLNWVPVDVYVLGQSLPYRVPLGLLMLAAFLLGLLPAMLWYKLSRWTVRRKLTKAEARLQAAQSPADAATTTADPEAALLARVRAAGGVSSYGGDVPPQARPMAVPPGGA